MRYLGQPYYVGLLSAAAIHGAAHQQPMVFQVVTSKPTREMRAGKVAIRFSMSSLVESLPVIEQQTETGTMRVATPETCAFDLVRYPEAAGHLSNAATVLAEPLFTFLRCPNGIDLGAPDGKPVRLGFLILTPFSEPTAQLQLLSQLARLAVNAPLRQRLLEAEKTAEVSEVIGAFESTIPL